MSTVARSVPRATTIAILLLGVSLGLLHIFYGAVSLTPRVSQDFYNEAVSNYKAFSRSLSFLPSSVDRVGLAFYLRHLFAILQLIFGSMLVENNYFGYFGKLGNLGLVALDIVTLVFQLSVRAPYDRIVPTLAFTILLIGRLVMVEQGTKKPKVGVKTRNAGKSKTSSPKKNKNE